MAKTNYKFTAHDFWEMLRKQKKKCALSGRELTPNNCEVELRNPHISFEEGRADLDNHYLICRDISPSARNVSEDEMIELALDIVRTRGIEKGFTLRKAPNGRK